MNPGDSLATTRIPIIAREGWPFLAGLAVAVSRWLVDLSVGRLVVGAVLARRRVRAAVLPRPAARGARRARALVLSPADGRIVVVGEGARSVPRARRAEDQRVHERVQRALQPRPVDGDGEEGWYYPGQVPQCRARQGLARERAQRAVAAHRRRRRRHLRAGRGPDRAPHPVLRRSRASGSRAGSATASSASARAWTSTCRRAPTPQRGARRQGVRDRHRARRAAERAERATMATPIERPRSAAAHGAAAPARHLLAAQPVHHARRCSPASTPSCRR